MTKIGLFLALFWHAGKKGLNTSKQSCGLALGLDYGITFNMSSGLNVGLATGIFAGLVSVLFIGPTFGLTASLASVPFVGLVTAGVIFGLSVGLATVRGCMLGYAIAAGPVFGLSVGLAAWLAFALIFGLTTLLDRAFCSRFWSRACEWPNNF